MVEAIDSSLRDFAARATNGKLAHRNSKDYAIPECSTKDDNVENKAKGDGGDEGSGVEETLDEVDNNDSNIKAQTGPPKLRKYITNKFRNKKLQAITVKNQQCLIVMFNLEYCFRNFKKSTAVFVTKYQM